MPTRTAGPGQRTAARRPPCGSTNSRGRAQASRTPPGRQPQRRLDALCGPGGTRPTFALTNVPATRDANGATRDGEGGDSRRRTWRRLAPANVPTRHGKGADSRRQTWRLMGATGSGVGRSGGGRCRVSTRGDGTVESYRETVPLVVVGRLQTADGMSCPHGWVSTDPLVRGGSSAGHRLGCEVRAGRREGVGVLFVGDDGAEDHHDVEVLDEAGRRLGRASQPAELAPF